MITKSFNYLGSRWNGIRESSLGNDWITIYRSVTLSLLKKHRGQVVTSIDVKKSDKYWWSR